MPNYSLGINELNKVSPNGMNLKLGLVGYEVWAASRIEYSKAAAN